MPRYEGQKFDGVDLWLADPHISIESTPDEVKQVCDHIASFGLKIGSMVAPIWGGAGGGSAMGAADDRKRFLDQVKKACVIGRQMRDIGIRPTGGIRINSSTSVDQWDKDPGRRHEADRRDVPRGRQDRRGSRRVPRRRGRDLLGRHAFLAGEREAAGDGRHARRRRLPGRHGALDAVHPRLQRREGSPPARGLRLEGPEPARQGLQAGRRRAPSVDARFPRRPERRHGVRLRRPRKDRPPLPGRTTRTASSISSSTPATGSATTRAT